MRLVAFRMHGYRRFESQWTLDLTPRVVAIVGPNEAGKSSLLAALEKLTDPTPEVEFSRSEFTGHEIPGSPATVLSGLFELESADREAISHIPGSDTIRLWCRERHASGQAHVSVIPRLTRDQSRRQAVASAFTRLLEKPSRTVRAFLDMRVDAFIEIPDDEELFSLDATVRSLLEVSLDGLQADEDTIPEETQEQMEVISGVLEELPPDAPKYASNLVTDCRELAAEHASTHPWTLVMKILDQRCPRVRVLRDDDRQLQTSYHFDDTEPLPGPLVNLLEIAGLTWDQIKGAAAETGNPQLATMLQQGNRRLASKLEASWKQSRVSIELVEHDGALHIYPYDAASETHSRIEDRSDGFKSFLALFAFTSRHTESERKLILGIDEAELHLHYDAQADLVQVLTQQTLVPQIIYTTHSAGCLPEDLGSAIRVVETTSQDRSAIKNGFWSANAEEEAHTGFTSLLMAMGAGAVAFTPTRRAVITEGPSDALLLPALLRASMDLSPDHPLGLQVAGGLAWTPPRRLGNLEAEAAHVAYITDSDEQGQKYREDLQNAGVPRDRIFSLKGHGLSVEDLVDKSTYVAVVNRVIKDKRGYDGESLKERDIPSSGASNAVDAWSRARGIQPVSKTAIAEHLLRVCNASLAYSYWDPGDAMPRPLLREARRAAVIALYRDLRQALGIASEQNR